MDNLIIFELPLNERVRIILRLNFLARQFDYFINGNNAWDNRAAVEALLDSMVLVDRSDLRTELIKELERQSAILAPLEKSPGVDVARLNEILNEFDSALDRLKSKTGPIVSGLNNNELLFDVQNRIGLPGGTCDFDLPRYHAWLARDFTLRKTDLTNWAEELKPIWDISELLLHIIRGSGNLVNNTAEKGFFQINFANEQSYQLVRVILPNTVNYYPEMSGDRHRVTIRFMTTQLINQSTQINEDVNFQLICCSL